MKLPYKLHSFVTFCHFFVNPPSPNSDVIFEKQSSMRSSSRSRKRQKMFQIKVVAGRYVKYSQFLVRKLWNYFNEKEQLVIKLNLWFTELPSHSPRPSKIFYDKTILCGYCSGDAFCYSQKPYFKILKPTAIIIIDPCYDDYLWSVLILIKTDGCKISSKHIMFCTGK